MKSLADFVTEIEKGFEPETADKLDITLEEAVAPKQSPTLGADDLIYEYSQSTGDAGNPSGVPTHPAEKKALGYMILLGDVLTAMEMMAANEDPVTKNELSIATGLSLWGMQKAALVELKVSDVYMDDWTPRSGIGPRKIPLPEDLQGTLAEYSNYLRDKQVEPDSPLFPNYGCFRTLARRWEKFGLTQRDIRLAGYDNFREYYRNSGDAYPGMSYEEAFAQQFGVSHRHARDLRQGKQQISSYRRKQWSALDYAQP